MSMSHFGRFKDGVSIAGMPTQFTYPNKVYWVDSNSSRASNSKGTFSNPCTTLDAALDLCVANKGDVIMIKPNHAETITGAGGITLDKAGVSIIGLGRYDSRPAFLMDGAVTVSMVVSAANCGMDNLVFRAGHADIAIFANIHAKGFHFNRCHLEENTTNENFLNCINAGTADNDFDGLSITDCVFDMVDAASTGCITLNKNSKDVVIQGNRINGDYGNSTYAPIYAPSTEVQKNIFVADNVIHNLHDANAAVGISIANTSSTGAIIRNFVGHQDTAAETPVLAGAAGLFVAENYCSGVLGTASGYLYPAADS